MKPYFWLGRDADDSPEIIDTLEQPMPLIVVDSTEVDE